MEFIIAIPLWLIMFELSSIAKQLNYIARQTTGATHDQSKAEPARDQ